MILEERTKRLIWVPRNYYKNFWVYEDEVEFDSKGLAIVCATVTPKDGYPQFSPYKLWGLIDKNYYQAIIEDSSWLCDEKTKQALTFSYNVKGIKRIREGDFLVEFDSGKRTLGGNPISEFLHVRVNEKDKELYPVKVNMTDLIKPELTSAPDVLIVKGCNGCIITNEHIYNIKDGTILPNGYDKIDRKFFPLKVNGKVEYFTTVEDIIVTGYSEGDLSTKLIFCINKEGKVVSDVYSSYHRQYYKINLSSPDSSFEGLKRNLLEDLERKKGTLITQEEEERIQSRKIKRAKGKLRRRLRGSLHFGL